MVFQVLSARTTLRCVVPLLLVPFLFLTLFGQQQQQQAKPKLNIAVLDFDARSGIKPEEAASLSDIFQGELVQAGLFTVVDRNRIKAILNEQGFQQSEACSQVECIVQVGNILKVERMFAGTIGKVGQRFTINIQMIDVRTAQIVSSVPRQHEGDIEDLASEIIPEIASEMIKLLTIQKVATQVKTTGGGTNWLLWAGGAVLVGGGVAAAILVSKKDEPAKPVALPNAPAFPN